MPMRKGTKVLGPSPEARMDAQEARSAAAARRAMRVQGEEARSEAPIVREGARAARKAGGVSRYAKGGGVEKRGKTKGTMVKMACGGSMKKYAKGGSIDGCATKGKTRGKMV